MAKKPQADIRKLKDEVAEHLKKPKWEKAAEVLEELAAAGRRQGAIELGDSPGTSADLVMTTGIDRPAGGEDEPLELDDGRSIKSPSFRSSMAALAPTPPDEPAGGELELDLGGSPPPL